MAYGQFLIKETGITRIMSKIANRSHININKKAIASHSSTHKVKRIREQGRSQDFWHEGALSGFNVNFKLGEHLLIAL